MPLAAGCKHNMVNEYHNKMKMFSSIRHILLAASVVLISLSCEKEAKLTEKLIGSWRLISIDDFPAGESLDVRLSFSAESFEIYQRAETDALYMHYSGTWSMSNGKLEGLYNNGTGWGSTYSVEISENILTLTSSSVPVEVTIYRREELPASVTDNVSNRRAGNQGNRVGGKQK